MTTSRYESQNVVNQFNIFVDSEQSSVYGHGHSKGDDVHLHMEGNSIEAQDGEIIRLTLTNFTMFNNLHMIDNTNRSFQVRTVGGTATRDEQVRLTRKNHKDLNSVATDFATVLATELLAAAVANGSTATQFEITSVKPTATSMSDNDNRLLEVTFTCKHSSSVVNHNINTLTIGCYTKYLVSGGIEDRGESYQILGGERIDTTTVGQSSFLITQTASTFTIKGFYPMQRMSDPYVYIRCQNVSNGLEMSVLDSSNGASGPDIVNSNILGKVFKDVEFISYHTQTGDDYFINLQQRRLSHLHLFLTDSKGRKLGRLRGDGGQTAAGLELSGNPDGFEGQTQSTDGNLFFTAVIKVEVIKVFNPRHLQTEKPAFPLPAREAQGTLVWPDYGRPKF
jgi:hypothetical protein